MLLLLNLFAGMAMLTWGVYITKTGVLRTFGSSLNVHMQKALSSKLWVFRALGAGVFTTALVQSSNATAMLVSSFLGKGIIKLTPALVIMLGANFGSAIMARILTFDLSFLSPLFLLIGICLFLSKRQTKVGKVGRILTGLGVILLALKTIVAATLPATSSETVKLILASLNGEIVFGMIFGAILAMLCYSSLAAVILTALITASGQLSLESALAIVIGANLGSCALEILGASGNGVSARRVMFGNLSFKLTLAILYLPFLSKIEKLPLEFETKDIVIWFHVVFNFSILVLMLPLTKFYARALTRVFPDVKSELPDESEPKYLDRSVLDNPELAVSNCIREALRLGGFLHDMLALFENSILGTTGYSDQIKAKAKIIVQLSGHIKRYMGLIEEDNLGHSARWNQCLAAVMASIQASDLIERMQSEVSSINHNREVNIKASSRADLIKLTKEVNENLSYALTALMTGRESDINLVYSNKNQFKAITDRYSIDQLAQIGKEENNDSADVTALIMILIADLRQLNGIFTNIASSNLNLTSNREPIKDNAAPLIKEE